MTIGQDATVEIIESGRGGTILYREGENLARFGWEFASSPVLALVFGDTARDWNQVHPWARDRQADIYRFVCAEIIRQTARDSACEIDFDDGVISVMEHRRRTDPPAGPVG